MFYQNWLIYLKKYYTEFASNYRLEYRTCWDFILIPNKTYAKLKANEEFHILRINHIQGKKTKFSKIGVEKIKKIKIKKPEITSSKLASF